MHFLFIFRRSWSQKQAEAKKQVNQATASQASSTSSNNQSQKFSYTAKNSTNAAATATASTTTVWDKAPKNTAPPSATNAADEKWQAKLNSNVAGTQQNAQDFTKEFMGQMYGGSTQ